MLWGVITIPVMAANVTGDTAISPEITEVGIEVIPALVNIT
jgi:hypothetical protein